MNKAQISIRFTGNLAEENMLDFYDAAHALVGFQRSLALTAHLVANGEIITQAPALKEAELLVLPSQEGSWKTRTILAFSGIIGGMAVAPHDSVAGNIAASVYDYVLSESLGVHADYNKTIGQLISETHHAAPGTKKLTQAKLDSLIEKCEASIKEMHRPIIKSETASSAEILLHKGTEEIAIGPKLTHGTYDYIGFTNRSEMSLEEVGRISGYDSNTYKGRVYLLSENRTVPFELETNARNATAVRTITNNLAKNAQGGYSEIRMIAFRDVSRTARLKRLFVVKVHPDQNT